MSTDQRTLRADARRNHERILSSGRELFARDGPEAQMDEIAAHAGVGIGTVYRHFPTKEALLTEMVRVRFQEFAAIATLVEDTVDPRDALETVMRRSAEAVEGDMGFQLAMMGSNQLEWEGIEEQKAVLAAVVTRIIRRAVSAGVVRDDFTFEDFGMMMCGVTSTMYYQPGGADWRRHLPHRERSLERSALVEAVAQFTQGLDLITTLPGTPALRREQIKLQVALINPLIHIKGHSAPETKAAAERARLLIEQAETQGEPLECRFPRRTDPGFPLRTDPA